MKISAKLKDKLRRIFDTHSIEDEDEAVHEIRFVEDDPDAYDLTEDDTDEIGNITDEDIRQMFRDWSEETGHANEKELNSVVEISLLHKLEDEIKDCPESGCHISQESANAMNRIIQDWQDRVITPNY